MAPHFVLSSSARCGLSILTAHYLTKLLLVDVVGVGAMLVVARSRLGVLSISLTGLHRLPIPFPF